MAGTIRELARRPSLLLCLALVSGLTVRETPVLALLGLAALFAAPSAGWRWGALGAAAVGLLLGQRTLLEPSIPGSFRAEAIVASTPRLSGERQICEVEVAGNLYQLISPEEPMLASGDTLSLVGDQRPIPSSFSPMTSRRLSGLLKVEPGGIRVLRLGSAPFRYGVGWRRSFVDYSNQMLTPEAAAAANALCFNVTSGLDAETYENLQRTGTVHIISASGLHVLIFALGLRFVLAQFPIPRGGQLLIVGLVLVVYAIGAGMRPPVVRSVAMAGILGSAGLLRREPDLLSALAAAAAGYLLWRPDAVYDIGFQLSFAAVAGLALFAGGDASAPLRAVPRLLYGVREVAKASGIATLATAPLTAYYFGAVSLISIPANVLIALALPPITLTAFAAHALSVPLPALGAGLEAIVVEPLCGWVLWVANTLGPLTFSSLSIPSFSAYWMIPYYGILILLWRPRARPA